MIALDKRGAINYYKSMKKHSGSCDKQCGHMLDNGHVLATTMTQRALDNDPRVAEYYEIEGGKVFEFVYAFARPVAAIYRATAAQLGIKELA